jgi:hypothetical protein
MAHEIETHGEQAAAVFARTDAWHRLGTTVRDRAFSAEEAMTLGNLGGWRVRKVPLLAHEVTADGVTTLDAPGYATVRDNPFTGRPEALGVVGAGYEPLQNEDHAEFLNHLADQSGAVFDTAGSLRGGRQVFITMQLPTRSGSAAPTPSPSTSPPSTATTAPGPSASWSRRCGWFARTPRPPRSPRTRRTSPSGTPATPRRPWPPPATRSG